MRLSTTSATDPPAAETCAVNPAEATRAEGTPDSASTAGCADQAEKVIAFFEALTPQTLARLGDIYSANATFKDPFNEVRGLPAITGIFEHMFNALDKPRFVVTECVSQHDQCFLAWNFEFFFKGSGAQAMQTIRGASHLKFTGQGLVTFHRDYWDAAEELYEKLPLVGSLMRWLKKRASS